MADPNGQNDNPAKTAQDAEPVVSKPYIMPDDPEEGSVEALAREAAEARDKMLRTLAEMENLRKRTSREVADARTYAISGFARDVLDIADNLQRALDAVPAEAKGGGGSGIEGADRGCRIHRTFAPQCAGEERRQEIRSGRREIRPEFPSGNVRSSRSIGACRYDGAGDAVRLHDWGPRAAPRAGRVLPRAAQRLAASE